MKKKVTPNRILDLNWDYAKTRAFVTAVELDVFTHIAKGSRTASAIASAVNSSLRGTEMLLNALVGLGLLTKNLKGCYSLRPDSREFLVRDKPGYLGAMSMHVVQLTEIWSHLTEAVKTGKPYRGLDEERKAEEFYPELVRALFNMNFKTAEYTALYLKKKGRKIADILDVAAGSCVWGIGFAKEFKKAKLTAIDFPAVCKVTREYIEQFKMSDRFKCQEGNLRDIDFGKARYDLIILGHICHSEGRAHTKRLLEKSFRALRKAGTLLIAEFLPNDKKTASVMALLFALNMLLNTDEGDVFTIKEFKEWLKEAGFKNIRILKEAPAHSPLILAIK